MVFIFFISTVFAIALFHRWEHRMMIGDIARILPALSAGNTAEIETAHDWRIVRAADASSPEKWMLRRAFHAQRRQAMPRYVMPVIFTAAIMIGLGSIKLGTCYALLCAGKWFLTSVEVSLEPPATYDVTLFGLRLFGEPVPA